jgi:hypothetical protein
MPGDEENQMFYSFNVGPVHFVSISTEYYYFVEYGTEQMVNQYHWLEQDLAQVTLYTLDSFNIGPVHFVKISTEYYLLPVLCRIWN